MSYFHASGSGSYNPSAPPQRRDSASDADGTDSYVTVSTMPSGYSLASSKSGKNDWTTAFHITIEQLSCVTPKRTPTSNSAKYYYVIEWHRGKSGSGVAARFPYMGPCGMGSHAPHPMTVRESFYFSCTLHRSRSGRPIPKEITFRVIRELLEKGKVVHRKFIAEAKLDLWEAADAETTRLRLRFAPNFMVLAIRTGEVAMREIQPIKFDYNYNALDEISARLSASKFLEDAARGSMMVRSSRLTAGALNSIAHDDSTERPLEPVQCEIDDVKATQHRVARAPTRNSPTAHRYRSMTEDEIECVGDKVDDGNHHNEDHDASPTTTEAEVRRRTGRWVHETTPPTSEHEGPHHDEAVEPSPISEPLADVVTASSLTVTSRPSRARVVIPKANNHDTLVSHETRKMLMDEESDKPKEEHASEQVTTTLPRRPPPKIPIRFGARRCIETPPTTSSSSSASAETVESDDDECEVQEAADIAQVEESNAEEHGCDAVASPHTMEDKAEPLPIDQPVEENQQQTSRTPTKRSSARIEHIHPLKNVNRESSAVPAGFDEQAADIELLNTIKGMLPSREGDGYMFLRDLPIHGIYLLIPNSTASEVHKTLFARERSIIEMHQQNDDVTNAIVTFCTPTRRFLTCFVRGAACVEAQASVVGDDVCFTQVCAVLEGVGQLTHQVGIVMTRSKHCDGGTCVFFRAVVDVDVASRQYIAALISYTKQLFKDVECYEYSEPKRTSACRLSGSNRRSRLARNSTVVIAAAPSHQRGSVRASTSANLMSMPTAAQVDPWYKLNDVGNFVARGDAEQLLTRLLSMPRTIDPDFIDKLRKVPVAHTGDSVVFVYYLKVIHSLCVFDQRNITTLATTDGLLDELEILHQYSRIRSPEAHELIEALRAAAPTSKRTSQRPTEDDASPDNPVLYRCFCSLTQPVERDIELVITTRYVYFGDEMVVEKSSVCSHMRPSWVLQKGLAIRTRSGDYYEVNFGALGAKHRKDVEMYLVPN
eukprot:PhM_4_TR14106/c0_g1_i1/m.95404